MTRRSRRGSHSKRSAQRSTHSPRPAAVPAQPKVTEELVALRAAEDESRRRWLLLWEFVQNFLEREAPDVRWLLHRRFAKYGLATPSGLRERPGLPPVLEWMIAPALLQSIPPREIIQRLEEMVVKFDKDPVERRGRKTETPLQHALIFYECYMEQARHDPRVRRAGETIEDYAIRRLSTRWGLHREHASWMKLLRRARREAGFEDFARNIARVAFAEIVKL